MGVGIGASPMPLRHQLNGIALMAMPLYIVFALVTYIIIAKNFHISRTRSLENNNSDSSQNREEVSSAVCTHNDVHNDLPDTFSVKDFLQVDWDYSTVKIGVFGLLFLSLTSLRWSFI